MPMTCGASSVGRALQIAERGKLQLESKLSEHLRV